MILLDTTVLVYAAGSDHPLREPCQRLLRAHAQRAVRCTTTVWVVQEFAHVFSRGRARSVACEVARRYMTALNLLSTTPPELALGLDLYEAHQGLGAFDAVLAAVALNRRVELVSADQAFAVVPGLRWIDPTSLPTQLS